LLSHAAVICREFGLPTVLGVRDATTRIRSGDAITVDGDRGTVQFIQTGRN
jgi:rifampicin phosphotransferase